MTYVSAARTLLAIAIGIIAPSCVVTRAPVISAANESAELKVKFVEQIRDLEYRTGKRYKGKTIHINPPVPAIYRDWRKMPVAKIRGRRQGGLTSWRAAQGHTTVTVAAWRGYTPTWLIRHEALHAILLSHSITGHPSRYANLFGKSYWWMPEAYYREKSRVKKQRNKPLVRSIFKPKPTEEILAACCPICGVDVETLAKQSQPAQ